MINTTTDAPWSLLGLLTSPLFKCQGVTVWVLTTPVQEHAIHVFLVGSNNKWNKDGAVRPVYFIIVCPVADAGKPD